MDRRRFSNALWCGVCYGFIALILLSILDRVLSALIASLTGSRHPPRWVEQSAGLATLIGAVAAFAVTFWWEYHKAEPRDPPRSQT